MPTLSKVSIMNNQVIRSIENYYILEGSDATHASLYRIIDIPYLNDHQLVANFRT